MSMPNWKNPEDYKYTEKLTGHGWAWEFLRRDKRYLADYAALKKNEVRDEFGNPPVSFTGTKLRLYEGDYILTPPLAKNGSVYDWVNKHVNEPKDSFFHTPREYIIFKWGLNDIIPDPNKSACDLLKSATSEKCEEIVLFKRSVPRIISYFHQLQEIPVHFDEYEISGLDGEEVLKIEDSRIIVEFFLDEKIKPQFNFLRSILDERQKKYSQSVRPQKETLLRRLRVLDASLKTPKIKKKKIQDSIYPENKNATESMTHDNDLRYLKGFKNKSSYLTLARAKI